MNETQRQKAILLHKTGRPIYQISMIVGVGPEELHEMFRQRIEQGIKRSLRRGEPIDEIAEMFNVEVDYVRRFAA